MLGLPTTTGETQVTMTTETPQVQDDGGQVRGFVLKLAWFVIQGVKAKQY